MGRKELMIDSIADLRQGMKLLCPEWPDLFFTIHEETLFFINSKGLWGVVDCGICGESHLVNELYYIVEPKKGA